MSDLQKAFDMQTKIIKNLRDELEDAKQEVETLTTDLNMRRKLASGQKKQWLYTFAGRAMQGILVKNAGEPREQIAKHSVEYARALLAELEKEPTGE